MSTIGKIIGLKMSRKRNSIRKQILTLRGNTCHYCGKQCHCKDPRHKDYATLDHLIPRSKGGLLMDENLVIACLACNQAKGCMTEQEFKDANIST